LTQSNQAAAPNHTQSPLNERLRALAVLFLKLGTISFGGPAAAIALMENEVVRKLAVLWRWKINPAWVVLGGGLAGVVLATVK
jgi:chromate transporter